MINKKCKELLILDRSKEKPSMYCKFYKCILDDEITNCNNCKGFIIRRIEIK